MWLGVIFQRQVRAALSKVLSSTYSKLDPSIFCTASGSAWTRGRPTAFRTSTRSSSCSSTIEKAGNLSTSAYIRVFTSRLKKSFQNVFSSQWIRWRATNRIMPGKNLSRRL
jgi:hypothetical protein